MASSSADKTSGTIPIPPPNPFGFPKFEDLQISTITIVVYTNVFFFYRKLFDNIKVIGSKPSGVHVVKKRKSYAAGDVVSSYGGVIMVNHINQIRGTDMRKSKKKHWCAYTCRPTTVRDGVVKKILRVIEETHDTDNGDVREVRYFCTQCQKYYTLQQLVKICNFLNQTKLIICIGENKYLNVMIFSNKLKIVGCTRKNDVYEAMMILWEDYIRDSAFWIPLHEATRITTEQTENPELPGIADLSDEQIFKLQKNHQAEFSFRTVMRNVGCKSNFDVNRFNFNNLMLDLPKDILHSSICNVTSHPNVTTKIYTRKPDGYMYRKLTYPIGNEPELVNIRHIDRVKKNKTKVVTFTLKPNKLTLSGRYKHDTKRIYEFIVDVINTNNELLEHKKTETPVTLDLSEFMFGE